MKKCCTCGETKSESEFNRNAQSKDGLAHYCRTCSNKRHKKWKENNPQRMIRYEGTRKPRPAYDPEEYKTSGRRYKRHGLTEDDYSGLLEGQNHECVICERKLTDWPCIDHDHSCCPGTFSCGNCVRGILCKKCNTALGGFNDDPALLQSAIKYLKSFSPSSPEPIINAGNRGPVEGIMG